MRLVADANVLLAALLGGRAKAVLQHSEIEELFTPAATFAEIQEYAIVLAKKKGLRLDTMLLALASLPVSIVERDIYAGALPVARKLIAKRDPDDVDVLALGLHMRLALWTNDNDFEGTGVEWYTTAELLKKLGIS